MLTQIPVPWHLTEVKAPFAWERGLDGSGIRVAIVDTGIYVLEGAARRNLRRRVVAGYGFVGDAGGATEPAAILDDHGHGTQMASIVGASHPADEVPAMRDSVYGVCPGARLVNLRVADRVGNLRLSDLYAGLRFLSLLSERRRIHVAVVALSAERRWSGESELRCLLQRLGVAGTLVVLAAGNYGEDLDSVTDHPSSWNLPNLVTVLGVDRELSPLAGSQSTSFGRSTVDLGAPGVGVVSIEGKTGIGEAAGTSPATAIVAGAAALLAQALPSAAPGELKRHIVDSSRVLPALSNLCKSSGVLDMEAMLRAAAPLNTRQLRRR